MNIKVTDLGQYKLKKLMAFKNSYCNKSQYTAPEHLLEKGSVVKHAIGPSDVYSFGMILYEIFLEREPFNEVPLKELVKIVAE